MPRYVPHFFASLAVMPGYGSSSSFILCLGPSGRHLGYQIKKPGQNRSDVHQNTFSAYMITSWLNFGKNRVMLPLPYLGELCFEIQHFAIKLAASHHLPSDTQAASGNRAVFLGKSGWQYVDMWMGNWTIGGTNPQANSKLNGMDCSQRSIGVRSPEKHEVSKLELLTQEHPSELQAKLSKNCWTWCFVLTITDANCETALDIKLQSSGFGLLRKEDTPNSGKGPCSFKSLTCCQVSLSWGCWKWKNFDMISHGAPSERSNLPGRCTWPHWLN